MAVKSFVLDYSSSIRFAFMYLLGTVVWVSIFLVPTVIVFLAVIFSPFRLITVLGSALGFILLVIILLSSFLWSISQTKHFACKIQFASSFRMTFNLLKRLNLAILIIGTFFMIIDDLRGGFFIVVVAIGLIYPLSSAYFILEWVFENKDNKNLTNSINFLYIQNEVIEEYNKEKIDSKIQIFQNQQKAKIGSGIEKSISIEMEIFCGYCGKNNKVVTKDQNCNNCDNALDTNKFNEYLIN